MRNSSFEFLIDLPANCIFVKHHGVFDYDIAIERSEAVASHKDYRSGLNRLIVMTDCQLDLELEAVRRLIDVVGSQSTSRGNYREAIFLDNPLVHGVARMFDSLKKHPGVEYQIFNLGTENVVDQLIEWLHLNPLYQFPTFLSISSNR